MSVADEGCPIHADRATELILAGEDLPPDFASCLRCAADLQALRDLRALGCALEWMPPDAVRADQVRARVVAALSPAPAASPRRLVRQSTAILATLAAGVAALVLVRAGRRPEIGSAGTPAAPPTLAVVQRIGAARFERTGQAPDEVVRLDEGRIHVAVAHLGPAERFRIVTGDAVVEVRGTEFDVQAAGERLEAVAVVRGRVEVRVGTNEPAVLTAGDSWTARQPAAPLSPVVPPVPEPARIAHTSRPAPERKEGAPLAERPAPVAEPFTSPVAPPPLAPAAELSPGTAIALPHQATPPVATQKPAAVVLPTRPASTPGESQRQERDDARADRRDLREERRRERLDRHR